MVALMLIKNAQKRICIIGAGITGLTAAYDLGLFGYEVILLEAEKTVGGLARYTYINGYPTDLLYHFICTGDRDLLNLIQELGINKYLKWGQAKTSYYYQGNMYNFGRPIDLIRFTPIPFIQRIKFGLNIIRSRYTKNWQPLDNISASHWLTSEIGQQGFSVIWDPLLRFKFGDYNDLISAAWIWHRIHRVAKSRRQFWQREYYGYLEGGSSTLIKAILDRLNNMPNITILTNARVYEVESDNGQVKGVKHSVSGEVIPCDFVISTIPLPILLIITPKLNHKYRDTIGKIEYLGVICGLLKLNHRLTDSFWLNIDDQTIPYKGVIEYSNLYTTRNNDNYSIVYIPYYLRTSSALFSSNDESLKLDFIHGLKKINPNFNENWIDECIITRNSYAQAICTVNFSSLVPAVTAPISGLFVNDSTQFYPEDRTMSGAIRQARYTVTKINNTY
jgi:protoporphyrinogen oxidase